MAMLALRAAPVFDATVTLTVPDPVPDATSTDAHDGNPAAVHVQFAVVVIAMATAFPAAGAAIDVGATV
jgi:hypothetical protein